MARHFQRPVRASSLTLKQLRETGDPLDGRTKEGKSRKERREFLQATREKFENWSEADNKQRDRELSDLSFYDGNHWPQEVKDARSGLPARGDMPPVPSRPCLTIDKQSEPVNQVLNQERDADLGIELTPSDDFEGLGVHLDETEIELREGLIRRIQRESQAATARSWAFKRAVIAGRGFYGVMTRFSPGKTFDQELYVTGWYNQACVTPDPNHEQPDGSDMEGGFVGNWMPWKEYKARWPEAAKRKNVISSLSDNDFMALGTDAPTWFKTSGDLRMVYVVDYFYTVKTQRELVLLEDGSSEWADEVAEDAQILDRREVTEQTVKWAKLDGANPEPLEETDWLGPDIPIVKVVGDEVVPYDEERRSKGLVGPSRDSNYGFDTMASKLVETVALTPIPKVAMANGQWEGFEDWIKHGATRALPFWPYNSKDAEGTLVGPPQPLQLDTPIQPIAMSLQMFDEAVQTTTRRHDPSLGKVDPTLRSGRAISQVINQSKEGTSNFLDNLRRSIRYEAQILNNLLYPVYGRRPGRLAKIVTGTGDPQTVMLGVPYTIQAKRPKPVIIAHPTRIGQTMPAPMGHPQLPQGAKQYALTEHANCNVNIKITRSYETRREEEANIIGAIINAAPEIGLTWFGDIFFKNQDGPGHTEMAERARAMLAPPIQQMLAAKDGGMDIPPLVQQQITSAKQAMEQAQQEIQQLQQEKAAKQTEQQGKLAIEREKQQHEDLRAAMEREVKIAVAEIAAQAKQAMQDMALFYEERGRIGMQIHETAMGGAAAAHNIAVAKHAAATDAMQSELEHQQQTAQNEQLHHHVLTQGAQAAELAPTPVTGNGSGE